MPEEVDQLSIVKGKDYCTLITCTPYGINTHRILVRGHRVDNLSEVNLNIVSEARRVPVRYVIVAIAVPMLCITALAMVLLDGRKKPKKNHRQLLEELRKNK